jgi:hypothetical protein
MKLTPNMRGQLKQFVFVVGLILFYIPTAFNRASPDHWKAEWFFWIGSAAWFVLFMWRDAVELVKLVAKSGRKNG